MKKPVTQPVESGGRSDEVVAREAWDRHLQRNRSIIVDLCQGQFKSKVVCPQCGKESITFDPYLFLSLPLPLQSQSARQFTFCPSPATVAALRRPTLHPFTVSLHLPKYPTLSDVKAALSSHLHTPLSPSTLLVTEVLDGKITRALTETALEKTREREGLELCIFEIPELLELRPHAVEKWTTLQVLQYVKTTDNKLRMVSMPTVVALPSALLSTMPLRDLYVRIKRCIASVIVSDVQPLQQSAASVAGAAAADANGSVVKMEDTADSGSSAAPVQEDGDVTMHRVGVDDAVSFELMLMDRQALRPICDLRLPRKDGDEETVNLMDKATGYTGMAFGCIHTSASAARLIPPPYAVNAASSGSSSSLLSGSLGSSLLGSSSSSRKTLTLHDCLAAFTKEETLRKSEAWYCSTCKAHQMASKKIDLWSTPDILVLHLKRFSFTSTYRDKLDVRVDFPIEGLDLTPWIRAQPQRPDAPSLLYDLYAVSNHYGGLGGGHYTAFARNLKNGQWYELDDSSVSPVHAHAVVTEAAYVLFYRRRGVGPRIGRPAGAQQAVQLSKQKKVQG